MVVFAGSEAVGETRPSAPIRHPFVLTLRKKVIGDGSLVAKDGHYVFARDTEFSSPSAAASVVHGGGANGLTAWKDSKGRTLKKIES